MIKNLMINKSLKQDNKDETLNWSDMSHSCTVSKGAEIVIINITDIRKV